jgi:hypothetical protein
MFDSGMTSTEGQTLEDTWCAVEATRRKARSSTGTLTFGDGIVLAVFRSSHSIRTQLLQTGQVESHGIYDLDWKIGSLKGFPCWEYPSNGGVAFSGAKSKHFK